MDDDYMRTHPCPYPTIEDLRRRRRQLRGLAGCGTAAIDRPDDEAWVNRWNKLYAEGQAKRATNPQPSPAPPDPKHKKPRKKTAPKPETLVTPPKESVEIRLAEDYDEFFPKD